MWDKGYGSFKYKSKGLDSVNDDFPTSINLTFVSKGSVEHCYNLY